MEVISCWKRALLTKTGKGQARLQQLLQNHESGSPLFVDNVFRAYSTLREQGFSLIFRHDNWEVWGRV